MKFCTAIVAALLTFGASSAGASTLITISSYDMPNGDGTAAGGDFNYWDAGYSNCIAGNCTTDGIDGSYLSGGKGKLTDGVIPSSSFFAGDGIGAYVGWLENPTITFHFGAPQTINEIKLFVDNSFVSGVAAPSSVVIDGTSYSDPSWGSVDSPQTFDITGLALNSSTIALTLNRSTASSIYWVFLSEAQFFGPSSTTPLPAALPLMLTGLVGFGVLAYRRAGMQRHAG